MSSSSRVLGLKKNEEDPSDCEDEDTTVLRNVGKTQFSATASHVTSQGTIEKLASVLCC
jgi:hypothetical protein